ncbi:small subunit ribosomal protein S7e [Nematocida sp. AWRm78]|nr:small subunit ribosomal protein S7e [Nematocida sp. AWRm79]KAI5182345.1 small subunit ribosomal protein S7e [Nematocida sp. AWRm78]
MSFKREDSNTTQNKQVVDLIRAAVNNASIPEEEYSTIKVTPIQKEGILTTTVAVSEGIMAAMKKQKAALIEKLESVLNGTVFIIRDRKVQMVEGKGGKQVIQSPITHAGYQERVVNDLVAPSHIVDRRTVIREDGSRLEKMIIEAKHKDEFSNRFEPMRVVFEEMFGKKALFMANYY